MEKPWLRFYPKEVASGIGAPTYQSVTEIIEDAAANYADRIAYSSFGISLTYRQVDLLATHFAAYLQSIGLKKGDRIAIQMPNLLQFPIAFFGSIKAGLVVVNTNPLYTTPEMDYQFKDADISAIVILSNFAHRLQPIIDSMPRHIIVTNIGDMLGPIKGRVVNTVVKHIKKMIPPWNIPHHTSFTTALKKGRLLPFQKTDSQLDDLAVLQYTGGTTGIAKGARLSHRNLVTHTMMISQWFAPICHKTTQETIITAIPLYHIFALSVNGLFFYHIGAKNVLITNPRDMPAFIKEMRKHKFTIFTGVNTLFNSLLNQPKFHTIDFSSLKAVVAGGMALQDAVAQRWEKLTGKPLIEGYGLSETSPVLCCNPLDNKHRLGFIGLPMPDTDIAILDDEGNVLPIGERGELCARGPQVMKGYWRSDNEGVFINGWFRTGDIGVMNEEGFFKIVDRKKDMIKVSGFNVYPNEIENVIAQHPKVLEVAAIGASDEKTGEAIMVFVVKRDASLTKKELLDFCRQFLTNYKIPKHIEFREEMPKSNVGKIIRRVLREEMAGNV